MAKDIQGYVMGKLLIEGKTKQVFEVRSDPELCLVLNKDRITAGDGLKAHDLSGKAKISNNTNEKIFNFLNEAGLKTAFIEKIDDTVFLAKRCQMIPIEWVTRRLAVGSYLKRNPGVPQAYRFSPPKHETFFKDDANHDPQWSTEQIIAAEFNMNGLLIGPTEVELMSKTSVVIFELLEKLWTRKKCRLVDMKIEFGVSSAGEILVADVIDSDSWRLWRNEDPRLMVDKQVYRNLTTVTKPDLEDVKRNFEWVEQQLSILDIPKDHLVVILLGSPADLSYGQTINKHCKSLGINSDIRVTSAHKTTEETLKIVKYYESLRLKTIFIAVAGRSNGLGPVVAGNTTLPVINCPPLDAQSVSRDVWSSLNLPSGLSAPTVLCPEAAALHAAKIVAFENYVVFAKLRVRQLDQFVKLAKADKEALSQK